MLCVCYRGGRWRWLSAHDGDDGRLVLVEQRGACPGDPDSAFVAFAGVAERDRLAEKAAGWLRSGWAGASEDERPARLAGRIPRPPRGMPVAADAGDRALDTATREAVVEASVNGAARAFCVFANPAVARR